MGFSTTGTIGATRMLFAANSMRAAAIASGDIVAPTDSVPHRFIMPARLVNLQCSVAPLALMPVSAPMMCPRAIKPGWSEQELAMRGLLNSVYVGTMGLAPSSGILGNAMAPNAFRIGQGGSLAVNTLKGIAGREYAAAFGDGIKYGVDWMQGDKHAPEL
ncbi:MAG: hypothetical protein R3C24_00450 [Cyanobacteriota/Melainabacteria group bacterium]